MRQIDQLLQTLDEGELNSLHSLPLQGKQREVMNALIASAGDGSHFEGSDLGLAPEHFHQICSVLLQKSYKVLAPKGLVDLSSFLAAKNLAKLLYQQLGLYEGKILHANRLARKRFYSVAFETSQWVSFDEYDNDLIDHFGKELLKARNDSPHGASCFVEIRKLRTTIREVFAADDGAIEKKVGIRHELERYTEMLRQINDERAHYQLDLAYIDYYVFIKKNSEEVLTHLAAARSNIGCLPKWLVAEEQHILDAQMADVEYMRGNFLSSYDLYEKLWHVIPPKRLAARNFYHRLRFAEVAVIVGKNERAKEVLNFQVFITNKDLIACSRNVRLAVIALLEDQVPEAVDFITTALEYNKGKSYMFINDIRLRFLVAVCAFLQGDWVHVGTLNHRALQFLQKNKLGLTWSNYGYYFKFIEAVMIQHEIGKPIPQKIQEHYKKYSEGHFKFFGLVLEKMLRSKGPNGWLPKAANDWYQGDSTNESSETFVKV